MRCGVRAYPILTPAGTGKDRADGRRPQRGPEGLLVIKFLSSRVSWNVNVGYTANGIAEITILDVKAAGYWPLENAQELLPTE